MSLLKAIFLGILALAAMSTAGYVTAGFAVRSDGAPQTTSAGSNVSIVSSSLLGNRAQESRTLAEVTATATPTATATATPEPSPPPEPAVEPTEPPPLPTETPEPPTPTPEPPTPTPEPPTPTPEPPTPTPEPPSPPPAATSLILGSVTPYSDALAGSNVGCSGYGPYDPDDPTVVAVGPDHYDDWPCGTSLGLCGIDSTGTITTCIVAVRQDSCPGCPVNHLDVSRAAFDVLCGPSANRCTVAITPLL